MANSSAVSILDSNSSAKTVSTIDSMYTAAGSPSATNVLTTQQSTAAWNITSLSSGTVAISSITGGTITTVGSVTSLASGSVTLLAGAATIGTVVISSTQLQVLQTTATTMSTGYQLVALPTDQPTVKTGGNTVTQASSVTITPATTSAYASGQLVANSTTPGSVNNLQFATLGRVTLGSGVIVGAALQKTTNVTTNAAFRLHYFNSPPTYISGGDHSALSSVVVASSKAYLGYVDITTMVGFSDVAWGTGAPDNTRGSIPYVSTSQIIYGLLEARSSYVPTSTSEVFLAYTMALQD